MRISIPQKLNNRFQTSSRLIKKINNYELVIVTWYLLLDMGINEKMRLSPFSERIPKKLRTETLWRNGSKVTLIPEEERKTLYLHS